MYTLAMTSKSTGVADVSGSTPVAYLSPLEDKEGQGEDYRLRYFELKERLDTLLKGISSSASSSRNSRKVYNLPENKTGSFRIYSFDKTTFEQIIAFEATNELPKYLHSSLTETGQIMWRFENTFLSHLFSPQTARSLYVLLFGSLGRFVFTYSLFGAGVVIFILGLCKIVEEPVFYFGFILTIFMLIVAAGFFLIDLRLYVATLACLPSFALIVFATMYPISLAYMMDWDYRSIPLIIYNLVLFVTVIGDEAMPRRVKTGMALFTNIFLFIFHLALLVSVNLGKFPDTDLTANIVTLYIGPENVTISALGMFNQSLVPTITLLCNLMYLYAGQWRGGMIKMKNISIALNYVDDPKMDDQLTMKYFKKYLVRLGLEEA